MKITISDQKQIREIQEEFNQLFPYLKLEFFSKLHKPGAPSSRKQMKVNTKTIGECRTVNKKGSLKITPEMTVNQLEQNFAKNYGLSVQIFRKSGKIWLETTATDGWTLQEQNTQGEELSSRLGGSGMKAA
jgi:hypothetical protein